MIRLNKNDWRNFMKKLLIVVDYQKDFVNGSLVIQQEYALFVHYLIMRCVFMI